MGLFDKKEKALVLHFKDDYSFDIKQREIEDTFLVEKKDGKRISAWKMFYKLQLPFEGYKSVKGGVITLTYPRDIIFDPFNLMKDAKDMPDKTNKIDKPWVSDVATSQGYTAQQEASKSMARSTTLAIIGCVTCLFALMFFITMAVNVWGS